MIEFTLKSGEIYDSNMGENYIEALNEAIAEYNQGGAIQEIPDNDGNIQYVKFDLSSTSEANGNYGFRDINGNWAYYSVNVRVENKIKRDPITKRERYAEANGTSISFFKKTINDQIQKEGYDEKELIKGVAIHEIGHNLGGEDYDKISSMSNPDTGFVFKDGKRIKTYKYPTLEPAHINNLLNRMDTRSPSGSGRLRRLP